MGAVMNYAQAIYAWLSGVAPGVPAYASTAVPSDAAYPYITYDLVVPSWLEGWQAMTVRAWTYGDSEADANEIVRAFARALPLGGVTLETDGGAVWLVRGSPFAQSMEAGDDKVKLRYILVDVAQLSDE